MRKLFMLINSLGGGGAEAVLVRLLPYLPVEKVFLLEREVDYPVPEGVVEVISSHHLGMSPIYKTLCIPYYAAKLIRRIPRGSVVVSFLERANFVNVLCGRFGFSVPVISVHMDQISGHVGIRKLNILLDMILYPRATRVVAVSKGVAKGLFKLGVPRERVEVIYNPYPIDDLVRSSGEAIEDFLLDSPFLLNVGRFYRPKGHWHLIKVFSELKKIKPDLKLILVGKGELLDRLLDFCGALGLRAFCPGKDEMNGGFDVYFMGFKPNPFKYMAKATVFVMSSLWEGFGNVLVEALACGAPVVSSDCPSGPREILSPSKPFDMVARGVELSDYGVLVPPLEDLPMDALGPLTRGQRFLLEALLMLLEDEGLRARYSSLGPERARHFDVKPIAGRWLDLLRSLGVA